MSCVTLEGVLGQETISYKGCQREHWQNVETDFMDWVWCCIDVKCPHFNNYTVI